ncbi:hypothetical protein [Motiliproteus sp. MSK22-1]|uniref:hypothetical protein n=1 Tax=Motiliproteus sp. MSK22-1 TaxID=1897630 RepID=UPI000977FF19|nr:hypothetical protein [Motiliproteus sp. MSK22-1]OMH25611.1 hypothetical protein BGP75_23985 [Motiliproteus sp. MSK22-1]
MTDSTEVMATSANKIRPSLVIWVLLLTVLLGYLGWLGRTLLQAQSLAVDILPNAAPCDIRTGPCVASRDQLEIIFAIDSPALDSSHPINLRVELKGFETDKVEVELQGRDMFMGQNTYKLNQQTDGSYRTEGRLPVCTTDLMTWRATVRVHEGQKVTGGTFDFEAR